MKKEDLSESDVNRALLTTYLIATEVDGPSERRGASLGVVRLSLRASRVLSGGRRVFSASRTSQSSSPPSSPRSGIVSVIGRMLAPDPVERILAMLPRRCTWLGYAFAVALPGSSLAFHPSGGFDGGREGWPRSDDDRERTELPEDRLSELSQGRSGTLSDVLVRGCSSGGSSTRVPSHSQGTAGWSCAIDDDDDDPFIRRVCGCCSSLQSFDETVGRRSLPWRDMGFSTTDGGGGSVTVIGGSVSRRRDRRWGDDMLVSGARAGVDSGVRGRGKGEDGFDVDCALIAAASMGVVGVCVCLMLFMMSCCSATRYFSQPGAVGSPAIQRRWLRSFSCSTSCCSPAIDLIFATAVYSSSRRFLVSRLIGLPQLRNLILLSFVNERIKTLHRTQVPWVRAS